MSQARNRPGNARRTQVTGMDAGQRNRRGPLAGRIAALVVVVAVGAGAGAGAEYAIRETSAAHLVASAAPSVSPAVTVSPADGLVRLAPAAALSPDAVVIAPVITAYFQAINRRDYARYLATQSPGQAMSAPQFQTAFRSTQDSGVLVTGITAGPDGGPAADVTFTSRQQPQDGPAGESCTTWHTTMYFDGSAGNYTLGAPPNGYKAAYRGC